MAHGAFQALHPFSIKEFKFNQGKISGTFTTPDYEEEGRCQALSLMWIKERLSNERAIGMRNPRTWFSARNSQFSTPASGDRAAHNEGLYSQAMDHELVWERQTGHNIYNFDSVEQSIGLTPATNVSLDPVMSPIRGVTVDIGSTMARFAYDVPNGHAISFSVQWSDPQARRIHGHAVALYKSRRGTVHFFDANCGSYKIAEGKQDEFFDAWVSCYSGSTLEARHTLDIHSFYKVYSRASLT